MNRLIAKRVQRLSGVVRGAEDLALLGFLIWCAVCSGWPGVIRGVALLGMIAHVLHTGAQARADARHRDTIATTIGVARDRMAHEDRQAQAAANAAGAMTQVAGLFGVMAAHPAQGGPGVVDADEVLPPRPNVGS